MLKNSHLFLITLIFSINVCGAEEAINKTILETGNTSLINEATSVPQLVENVRTYKNQNGVEVFYGYEGGKIDSEELLEKARILRTERNIKSSSGFKRQRTTNYRDSRFSSTSKAEDIFYNSAPKDISSTNVGNNLLYHIKIDYQNPIEKDTHYPY